LLARIRHVPALARQQGAPPMQLNADDREIILDALFFFSMNPEMRGKPEGTKAGELFLDLTDAKEFHFSEEQAAR
jgi:hypothetical protein